MPKIIAAVLMLATLALLSPGRAVAGPPEGVSGKMVFDRVGAGLDRYRKEADPKKRLGWLKRLAPTCDARIGVALLDSLPADSIWVSNEQRLLEDYFVKGTWYYSKKGCYFKGWMEEYEADLRRRAAQLPK
jgi:hypothetical protein